MSDRISFSTREIAHEGGSHVTVTIFAGPAGGTRANCGSLVLKPDEARDLVWRIASHETCEGGC